MPGPELRHGLFPAHPIAAALVLVQWFRSAPSRVGRSSDTAREYVANRSCSGGGMRPRVEILRAGQGLLLLIMALALCLGVSGTGRFSALLGPGMFCWNGCDQPEEVSRQASDQSPDDDNESSDVDVDDGDQKVDAVIAPASAWLGFVQQSGTRFIHIPPRMWRSRAQLGVGLPRAPPALG